MAMSKNNAVKRTKAAERDEANNAASRRTTKRGHRRTVSRADMAERGGPPVEMHAQPPAAARW